MIRLHGSYCTGSQVMNLVGNSTGTPAISMVSTMSYLWSQTPFPRVGVSFHDDSFNLSDYAMITRCHHSSCHESNTCKETVKNVVAIHTCFVIITPKFINELLLKSLIEATCNLRKSQPLHMKKKIMTRKAWQDSYIAAD